jgi:signal peptidase I
MDDARRPVSQPPASTPMPPAAGGVPAPPPAKIPPPKENIKETIESIIIAFILAFVFRAFVVEAFVIPSGSMAPTLLGAHMNMRCQDCGYPFKVNFPYNTDGEDLSIPARSGPRVVDDRQGPRRVDTVFAMHCPNCGFQAPRTNPHDPAQAATNTPVHHGDRILVLKYLYLLREPQRWDVVVFKSPVPADGPARYSQNYIKRLVGKPGEAIMILDGDIYVRDDSDPAVPEDQRPWIVQTKPRAAQESLWRIVYDNDFYPQNSRGRQIRWNWPWKPIDGEGWQIGENGAGRIVRFKNPQGAGTLLFDRDANRGPGPHPLPPFPLTDWLAYDVTKGLQQQARLPYGDWMQNRPNPYGAEQIPRWNVSDVKLQFSYRRHEGDGPLRARITKFNHRFIAEFHPTELLLIRETCDWDEIDDPDSAAWERDPVAWRAELPAGRGPLNVEFSNVDYRVAVRVNGHDLIVTTPRQYAPDVHELTRRHELRSAERDPEVVRSFFPPPRIAISAERQTCSLSHLSLWRDVYYTPTLDAQTIRGAPQAPVFRLHRRGEVALGERMDNEYFVLGDNSILSSDGRAWSSAVDLVANEDLYAQAGAVPERFLLGKAFFVYWPAGWRPFTLEMPGLVPNFGEMRIIH